MGLLTEGMDARKAARADRAASDASKQPRKTPDTVQAIGRIYAPKDLLITPITVECFTGRDLVLTGEAIAAIMMHWSADAMKQDGRIYSPEDILNSGMWIWKHYRAALGGAHTFDPSKATKRIAGHLEKLGIVERKHFRDRATGQIIERHYGLVFTDLGMKVRDAYIEKLVTVIPNIRAYR